jgi:hypothetical protein
MFFFIKDKFCDYPERIIIIIAIQKITLGLGGLGSVVHPGSWRLTLEPWMFSWES